MIALRLLQVIDLCFEYELTFALNEDRQCMTVLVEDTPIEIRPSASGSYLWDVSELLAALDAIEDQREAA